MTWHQYQELYVVKYVGDGDFIVISEETYNLRYNRFFLQDFIKILRYLVLEGRYAESDRKELFCQNICLTLCLCLVRYLIKATDQVEYNLPSTKQF